MIPRAQVAEWRAMVPWAQDWQVEQDLVISRALVEIFSDDLLRSEFAFRGGTALHKLYFKPAERYSEDIDLVRVKTGPIRVVIDALRARIEPWLGHANYEGKDRTSTLKFRFLSEGLPPVNLRLKVEINVREQLALDGLRAVPFRVESRWFSGQAAIVTCRRHPRNSQSRQSPLRPPLRSTCRRRTRLGIRRHPHRVPRTAAAGAGAEEGIRGRARPTRSATAARSSSTSSSKPSTRGRVENSTRAFGCPMQDVGRAGSRKATTISVRLPRPRHRRPNCWVC